LRVRFQADADLRGAIVKGVKRREPIIDFVTGHDARLAGLDDMAVLAIAADDSRLSVSHDLSAMPGHIGLGLD
jgi:hypothetical protein